MNILNAQVRHSKYGIGFVIDQNETIIAVRFNGEYGVKKFLYPSIFETYLTLCNQALQSEQTYEILRRHAECKAEAALRMAEEEKRRDDRIIDQKTRRKTSPGNKSKTSRGKRS